MSGGSGAGAEAGTREPAWFPREETVTAKIDEESVQNLWSAINHERPYVTSRSLRPLWHWGCVPGLFDEGPRGSDGHPRRGGFLPPVERKRRMFASGRCEFHQQIFLGDHVTRRGLVTSVEEKSGSLGALTVVGVEYRFFVNESLVITEHQTIIYTDAPPAARSAPNNAGNVAEREWSELFAPDEVDLFRFSSATSNCHRIHYDKTYAQAVEGYNGLVVHGPLQVLAALNGWQSNGGSQEIRSIEFRLLSPAYVNEEMAVFGFPDGDRYRLGAEVAGVRTFSATVTR